MKKGPSGPPHYLSADQQTHSINKLCTNITVVTRTLYWELTWSIVIIHTFILYIYIVNSLFYYPPSLYEHVFPSGFLHSRFPTNMVYANYTSTTCITWPQNLILLDSFTLLIQDVSKWLERFWSWLYSQLWWTEL